MTFYEPLKSYILKYIECYGENILPCIKVKSPRTPNIRQTYYHVVHGIKYIKLCQTLMYLQLEMEMVETLKS